MFGKCKCGRQEPSCFSNPEKINACCNEGTPVLFHKTTLPAQAGDEKTNPPLPGLYRNTVLVYEATNEAYLYSSDGIPTKLTDKSELGRINQLIATTNVRIDGAIKMIDDERAERAAADAKMPTFEYDAETQTLRITTTE